MRKYSIRDIENITGIKAHTIRVWEQRYNLIFSERTETNIRSYDDRDLCTFLNISTLIENKYKISEIAKMSPEEIAEIISALSVDNRNPCVHVNAMTEAMLEFDQRKFNYVFDQCIIRDGIMFVMENTIFPFLRKVGLMWQTDVITPSHEHFVTNILKSRLITAIESLPYAHHKKGKRFLLFLPYNEEHEIGLIYANYLIKQSGNEVLFLGQSVPYNNLRFIAEKYEPHFCLTTLTSLQNKGDLTLLIDELLINLPFWPLIISGPLVAIQDIPFRERLISIKSVVEFKNLLENVAV